MDWLLSHKVDLIGVVLVLLPHLVALSPTLAKGEGVLTAVLNFLAGNYGSAENKNDKKKGK